MKLSTLLVLGTAIVVGAYATSKEGDETRKKLKVAGENVKPIVKDLIKMIEAIVEKSKTLKSDEVRLNLEQKVEEVKKTLSTMNVEEVTAKTMTAIKTTSQAIRQLWTSVNNEETKESLQTGEMGVSTNRKKKDENFSFDNEHPKSQKSSISNDVENKKHTSKDSELNPTSKKTSTKTQSGNKESSHKKE